MIMRRRARTNKPIAEINVVPYIDVMLVLLIIFMVTAPMLVRNVDVELPVSQGDPGSVAEEQPPIVLGVTNNGFLHEPTLLHIGQVDCGGRMAPQPVQGRDGLWR